MIMFFLQSVLWILMGIIQSSNSCEKSPDRCCYNFYREGKICRECPVGTHGLNCSEKCVKGYYGRLCLESCDRPANLCDLIYGCYDNSSHISTAEVRPLSAIEMGFTSSSWKNTAFITIGLLGSFLIIGVMYCMKSWFIKMKTRAASNRRRASENTAHGDNINLWNIYNEIHEENILNRHTNSNTSLLVQNRALQEGTLGIATRKCCTCSTSFVNEQNCTEKVKYNKENKLDDTKNEYQDAWSAKTFLDKISRRRKVRIPQREQGVDIIPKSHSFIKYNRPQKTLAEHDSTYDYIDDVSVKRGNDYEPFEEDTGNDTLLASKGTRQNTNDEPYKQNKEEITEIKAENIDHEYKDAWCDENFFKFKTLGNISNDSNLTSSRMNNGVDIKLRPYSSVKYNRKNNVRETKGDMNSAFNNIGDISKVGDEDQRNEDNTKTDFVIDFGGKKDASPELIEYEDMNALMAVQSEHNTEFTLSTENSYSVINKNREITERELYSRKHLYKAENIVESTEMYTVPNFLGRESILNEDSSATNSKEDKMIKDGEAITEENWSIYEDETIL